MVIIVEFMSCVECLITQMTEIIECIFGIFRGYLRVISRSFIDIVTRDFAIVLIDISLY